MADKLRAVVKQWEGVEQEVLQQKSRLEEVTEKRRELFLKVASKREELANRVKQLQSGSRPKALVSGDCRGAYAVTTYLKRIEKELLKLKPDFDEREGDYKRSADRLLLIEQELAQTRAEKKRVENIIEKRERIEKVRKSARSELDLEEMILSRLHARRGR